MLRQRVPNNSMWDALESFFQIYEDEMHLPLLLAMLLDQEMNGMDYLSSSLIQRHRQYSDTTHCSWTVGRFGESPVDKIVSKLFML